MSDPQPNNPLHGITLEQVVTRLEKRYGWEYLARNININCFKSNPSVKSSLKFLRRTPWARDKVEALYVAAFANSPLEVPVAAAKAAPVTPSIVGADTVADVASNESSKVPSHSGSNSGSKAGSKTSSNTGSITPTGEPSDPPPAESSSTSRPAKVSGPWAKGMAKIATKDS
jgi:uncharacterized protein (DUF2132 family)